MGRLLLVARLAARDLRRRPAEAALLLLAIVAATTTLTLGLVMHGIAGDPYQRTREATAGPDIVASMMQNPFTGEGADPAQLEELTAADGVTASSGPFRVAATSIEVDGRTADVQAVGRPVEPVAVDQPAVVDGEWLGTDGDDGVVVEAAFAEELGIEAGDTVTLGGESVEVAGIAVTAAMTPYPWASCLVPCAPGPSGDEGEQAAVEPGGDPEAAGAGVTGPPAWENTVTDPGLIWVPEADVAALAAEPDAVSHVVYLQLADPDSAQAFADARMPDGPSIEDVPWLEPWQHIVEQVTHIERNAQRVLLTGGWLLGVLAVAGIAVLVGGRMADQTRRVGLLKAVGGTPGLVAAVLLAEYLLVALVAAATGLVAGRLVAPAITDRTLGLIGGAGTPSLTVGTIATVTAIALGVAVLATFIPAIRAARTSTVAALNESARPPRRVGWLVALSARLPVVLLIALRVAGRRPRRFVLSIASITVTVSGIVAAMGANAQLRSNLAQDPDARMERLGDVLLVITITLIAMAAVNAIVATWATVLDSRHASAVTRALGATPAQLSAGLSLAQVLPAFVGALLGVGGGLALYAAVDPDEVPMPPIWWLVALVPGLVIVVAILTLVPARLAARRPVAPILQAETA
ncbi:ABC transporter permease [Jiangella mangrovi]|uniref:Putative ABC transport system permease protein n=1 Tax=Jiangella mangrovi TaxID=1524084 RepID=A0A7W9GUV5_9ACTN|nr:FtsX-like permease family protein [Jiangella mangrovi]MBB5790518.1 putative ABC transport system permease protein [Jiangella mangrovi]